MPFGCKDLDVVNFLLPFYGSTVRAPEIRPKELGMARVRVGSPVKLPGLYGSVKSLQGRRLSARS
jgi:hypothetical protein